MARDAYVHQLEAIAALAAEDLFLVVDDPAGTPLYKKATGTQLVTFLEAAIDSLVFSSTGCKLLDTGGDQNLTLKVNENLSANRVLSVVVGDADRTLTLGGDATINQDVSSTASPSFAGLTVSGDGVTALFVHQGGTSGHPRHLVSVRASDDISSAHVDAIKARGTPDEMLAVQVGDHLGTFQAGAWTGTEWQRGGYLSFFATQVADGVVATKAVLTTARASDGSNETRLEINEDGLATFFSTGSASVAGIRAQNPTGGTFVAVRDAIVSDVGDTLGRFAASGADNGGSYRQRTFFQVNATQAWTATAQGLQVRLYVTPNDSTTALQAVTVDQSGDVGIGITAPAARLHVVKTTEQCRIGYDDSNYFTVTVGSTGTVTFDAVGAGAGFVFADGATFNGKVTLGATGSTAASFQFEHTRSAEIGRFLRTYQFGMSTGQYTSFDHYRARGTPASPASVASGDYICAHTSYALDASATPAYRACAFWFTQVEASPAAGGVSGRFNFVVTDASNVSNYFIISSSGSLGVGCGVNEAFPTGMTRGVFVKSGNAPSSSPADAFSMYSADQAAGNACPHIRTENGGIVKLYQQAAIADAAGGDEVAKINAILGVLRNAGLIAT